MRVAVVGHVEWIEFVEVARVPLAGEIVHAREHLRRARRRRCGRGGAARSARGRGDALHGALERRARAARARRACPELGIRLHASTLDEPQRRGFTYLDDGGERTITIFGARLGPRGEDASLPWEELAEMDAVYFVSGDVAALRAARAGARASSRRRARSPTLQEAGSSRRARRQRGPTRASATPTATSTRRRATSSAPRARPAGRSSPDGVRWDAGAAPRPRRGRLRLRRLLRSRRDVRARARTRHRRSRRVGRALRRRRPHPARSLRRRVGQPFDAPLTSPRTSARCEKT